MPRFGRSVGSRSTKVSRRKRLGPGVVICVPGDTGGTGASVRMYSRLLRATRPRSRNGWRAAGVATNGGSVSGDREDAVSASICARCASRFWPPRGSISGWNHVATSTPRAGAISLPMSITVKRTGASCLGSIASFSSDSRMRWSSASVRAARWKTNGGASVPRGPAVQRSLPHGNGRRSRAAGHGQRSTRRSSARRTREGSSGPSQCTTSVVLLLACARCQRECWAMRTRSAPRTGRRRRRPRRIAR